MWPPLRKYSPGYCAEENICFQELMGNMNLVKVKLSFRTRIKYMESWHDKGYLRILKRHGVQGEEKKRGKRGKPKTRRGKRGEQSEEG